MSLMDGLLASYKTKEHAERRVRERRRREKIENEGGNGVVKGRQRDRGIKTCQRGSASQRWRNALLSWRYFVTAPPRHIPLREVLIFRLTLTDFRETPAEEADLPPPVRSQAHSYLHAGACNRQVRGN